MKELLIENFHSRFIAKRIVVIQVMLHAFDPFIDLAIARPVFVPSMLFSCC